MTTAIDIDSVCKTYRSAFRKPAKEALKSISLTVAAGETFGFVGPNGAGKSTLIKILVGALQPTSGSARLFGCSLGNHHARRGVGFVPENPSLQDFLTPYETLLMGLRLHDVRVDDERGHCLRWLERFDLAAVADTPLRGFSKGMLQRTALAHAMVVIPRLLILDEPLSGLDPVGRKDVVDILDEYRKGGGTLFFSSHVLYDVERIADRFGLIHKGELLAVQSPNELVGGAPLVTVRSFGVAPVEGFVQESGERWVAEVSRDRLWEVLEALRSAEHILLEVKPTLSLESAFMRAVGRG